MKKKITVISALFITAALAITVLAVQPGTNDDPLVSKSYVDGKINEIAAYITGNQTDFSIQGRNEEEIVSEVIKTVEPLIALLIDKKSAESSGQYVPVFASEGQIVLGGEGTEMILRSGRGFAYIAGAAGIVNATSGQELLHNGEIPKNNIIIVPRGDGRGIRITEDAWFIIKGGYDIQ